MGTVGQSLPTHERTPNHDDTRLSIMEELVTLHPQPLDTDRLLRVYQIPTGERFPPQIRGPTPQYLSIPRKPGSRRTLPFHHPLQPISPPGAGDLLVPPLPRTLVENFLGIGTRVEAPQHHKRTRYDGGGR